MTPAARSAAGVKSPKDSKGGSGGHERGGGESRLCYLVTSLSGKPLPPWSIHPDLRLLTEAEEPGPRQHLAERRAKVWDKHFQSPCPTLPQEPLC